MLRRSYWRAFGVAVPVAVFALAGVVRVSWAQERPAAQPKGKDIVVTATEAATFKTFCKLVTAAELTETLKGEGPYTVFAPNDAAFEKLPKGTVDDWMKPENKAKLTSILNFHVIKGKNLAADVQKMKNAKALNGQEITFSEKEGTWYVNNTAKITKTDTVCSNGVIHTIDTVLMPKERH